MSTESSPPDAEKYAYRVMWSESDRQFVGRCAEFCSLSCLADTQTGALIGIVRLVADVLEDLDSRGEPIPRPISLQKFRGGISLRVTPELHASLALQAEEQGVSMNRLLCDKLAR